MKKILGIGLSVKRWVHSTRSVAIGAMLAAGASAWAQNAVSTLAGTAGSSGSSNTLPGTFNFSVPAGVAVDSSGNIFVADVTNHVIRKITVSSGTASAIAVFAGSGTAGSADGTGASASFSSPQGLAIDGANNLYVADTGNHAIRMITSGGVVTTLAGTAGGVTVQGGNTDNTGTLARFNTPLGIACDRAGGSSAAVNVYVADTQNNSIRQVVVSSKVVTTVAGSTTSAPGSTNAVGTAALFFHPDSIVSDSAGTTLYVADTFNHLIRKIVVTGGTTFTVSTLAGSGSAGYAEGTTTAAVFNQPMGVTISAGGNILVADTINHVIRSITPAGVTSLLAGTAISSGSTDGLATAAKFNFPSGITADATKTYIVDTNNKTVRVISAATGPVINTPPANQTVAANATATFTVSATGNPPVSYQWQRSIDSGVNWSNLTNGTGGVSGATTTTLTIASVTLAQSGNQFRVLVTNGVGGGATSTAASLTVTQAAAITSANNATFIVGQSNSFTVVATGSPTPTFNTITSGFPSWATFNTTTGVISGTPLDNTGSPFTFTVSTVANTAGPSASQSFTLTVVTQVAPGLTGPTNQTVAATATTAGFTVAVTSGSPAVFTYQWQRAPAATPAVFADISDGASGNLTFTGTTTASLSISGIAPSNNGDVFRVRVTNAAGTTTSSGATLVVLGVVPSISASPSNSSTTIGQNATFTASVAGNPAPTLKWQRAISGGGFNDLSDDATYSGTTTTQLTVTSVTAGMNNDSFRLVATNQHGQATSSAATLTITSAAPLFTSSPQNVSVNVGQPASFTAVAVGSPTPTLLWQRQQNGTFGWVDLPTFDNGIFTGTTTSTLGINAVSVAMNGDKFRLVATNSNGSTTSSEATLTVISSLPSFSTQPVNQTVNAGANATFTVVATGSPAPTLRWQKQQSGTVGFLDLVDDGIYSGTTSSTLTVNNVTFFMSGDQFRAVATNDSGSNPSLAATLIVNVGTAFTTFAGQAGVAGSLDGAGVAAQFNGPTAMALGVDGSIYVADTANHVIRKVTANGVVTTIAGKAGVTGSVDGAALDARFNSPQGVAVDNVGNVYVSDTFNHTIRVIATSGLVSTLAGTANSSGNLDGVGSAARFFLPAGLAMDSVGTIYVADSSNHAIRRITFGGQVTTYAGTVGVSGFVNNVGLAARFSFPTAVALDTSGNLYVADSLNNAIRKIQPGGNVLTLAGSGLAGVTDGNGTNALFSRPNGVAVDTSGNVYVADTFASTIRKITATGDVTTIAGLAGFTGSADGAGQTARFNQPFGIAVDSQTNIYVADTRNHTIRRSGSAFAPSISTQPTGKLAPVGGTVTFTVTATGTPTPVYQWQRATADSPDFFSNVSNDGTFSGVNTSQLTITGVTAAMNGLRLRVIVTNGVLPAATSDIATLTIGAPPVFTSAGSATFRAGEAGSFTVTATNPGINAVVFSLTGNPSWMSINSSTGVITGTPPDTSGSPLSVTVNATNGVNATQTLTVTILPAQTPPAFVNQPSSATVDQGQSATFSVNVSGTTPFTYQWRFNGVAIAGATGSSLTIGNAQAVSAGSYTVAVTNVAGTVISNAAALTVNTPPAFTSQPRTQVALAGSAVTFTVSASGSASFTYQWRKNGVNIPGANSGAYTIGNVTAADAGNYDVFVSSSLGTVLSSLAQLTIVTAPTAPVITAQPASRTVLLGSPVVLTAAASGAPTPSYQWRKNGAALVGQTNPTLAIGLVQASDAAVYDVVISNSAGSVTSAPAVLTVIARSYAGIYFGSFSASQGEFAIYVRSDNTGVFLGYLPGQSAPIMSLNFTVSDSGQFSFNQAQILGGGANGDEPARGAALGAVSVNGSIASDGSLSGSVQNGASLTLTGSRASDAGTSQNVSGFYQAGSGSSSASVYTIAGADGRAFVVEQTASASDGGRGTVTSAGTVAVSTTRSLITESITSGGTVSGSSTGVAIASFSGGSDVLVARQRLLNISSRARVATADQVAIAGFVISGEESKPVLIRAVGPTLSSFGVAGSLASPRLELFRGSTSLAVNTGIASNRAAIDAAGVQAGAFALNSSGADAAILTTLAPGNYTAVVSSATSTAGIALIEVYDLSAPAAGQKLLNISTRAAAGTAEATLTAGFVVPDGPAKRVLIRGIGPGLSAFGVTGVLAQPTLTLIRGSTTVATNTSYVTSPDRADIVTASAQTGGFGLANADSALLLTLPPGNYTAQVVGPGTATGVALIEVYEVP